MDTSNAVVSTYSLLNEQIAHQIFDALPERGPIVAIMDRNGQCRPSDPQEFAKLNLGTALLADLRAQVDDGVEPIFTHAGDTSVTVSQLAMEHSGSGYVIVAIPRCGSELTQTHLDLVESLLNQITLVASLVERNHVLNRMQAGYSSVNESGAGVAN
jgi:hypothetical protein